MDPKIFKKHVSETFCDLFPEVAKKLTPTQKEEWVRVCGDHDPETVCQVLRAMYRESDEPITCAKLNVRLKCVPRNRQCAKNDTFPMDRFAEFPK